MSKSVWAAYFPVYIKLLKDTSRPVADIRPYVSQAEFSYIKNRIKRIRDEQIRLDGSVTTRGYKILDMKAKTAIVCIDNGTSELVDKDGKRVSNSGRTATSTIKLTFVQENANLVLDRDEAWSESSVC